MAHGSRIRQLAAELDIDIDKEEGQVAPQPATALSPIQQFAKDFGVAEQQQFTPPPQAEQPGLLAGIGSAAIGGLSFVGETIDRFTGAPIRKGIGELQEGGGLLEAAGAGLKQIGRDPGLAPTGKEIAMTAGVSTTPLSERFPGAFSETGEGLFTLKRGGVADISPAGAAGLGIDVLADPTLLIPGAAIAKGARAVGGAVKTGARAVGTVADIATGGRVFETTAEGIAAATRNTKKALDNIFKPKVAGDFQELSAIAQKNGIDPSLLPEAIEFGETSFISRAARGISEGPAGQARLEKFTEGLGEVAEATSRKIEEIGGTAPLSQVEAGDLIRKGFDDGLERAFDAVELGHDDIIRNAPGLTLNPDAFQKLQSTLNGIEKGAKRLTKRGVTTTQKTQGEQLINAIDNIRTSSGSYKQAVEALRDIGDVAFKNQNVLADIPPDIAKLRKIYGALSETLVETVRKSGSPEIAEQLVRSNKEFAEIFGDKSILKGIIGNKSVANETVFKRIIESGDTKKIQAIKRFLTPEELQALKGTFLEGLLKRDEITGDISFKAAKSFMNNKQKQAIMGALFEPDEISGFAELIQLGDRFGIPILSTSGTGASGAFRRVAEGVKESAISESLISGLKTKARGGPEAARLLSVGGIQTPVARTRIPKELARIGRLQSIQETGKQR